MIAGDIMTTSLLTVDKDRNIEDAMRIMEKHGVSRLLATEKGRVVGIITESDIAERLASGRERKLKIDHIHVSAGMKKYLRVVYPETDVREVAAEMIKQGISSLVVEDKGVVVGIVTKTDLVRTLSGSKKRIEGFYTRNPVFCNLGDSLVQVRKLMLERGIHRVIVSDKGMIVGMVTDRDMARGLRTYRMALDKFHHPDLGKFTVENVMARDPILVEPKMGVGELVKLMLEKRISGFPVVCENYGVITKTDLVRALAEGGLP